MSPPSPWVICAIHEDAAASSAKGGATHAAAPLVPRRPPLAALAFPSSNVMVTATSSVNMGHLGLACEGDGVDQMLEEHPTYLECFSRLHHEIMAGDGPLPEHYRRYIAIMAACRHNCSYLVEEQRQAFREAGGPEEWLVGLEYAPKKLQELHHTNLILAHQPWLYDIHHVEKLLKSCWSVSELTQAICILAQFHALSSYVHGCGIEVSSGELAVQPPFLQACSSGSPSSVELSEGGVDVLVERMRSISLVQSDFNAISEEQTRVSFEKLKKQAANISSPNVDGAEVCKSRYSHLSPNPEFIYVDFHKRGEKSPVPTIKSQDCSWEEHGFSLVSELYSEVADILDNKFKTAYNMTYYTCGHKTHVDTFLFRQAVWNYLHCLYGIRHDDYDYSQINQLLERNLKMFLKTVTCFPERLSSLEASPFIMKGFLNSEKVHVMVLVLEGRLQAELLHGLRALGHYLM
ncbi:sestrin-2 isoform X1 [Penaeus vannamei]|uniref:sestrin-2 isoform X1 n=2 Tax=Penaeus vannamei TaxID=6689 RepID=UPI00387F5E9E